MRINRVYLETIGSTNTWAKEHAGEFDQEALIIITADEQTSGRGRFNRSWVSPKGCNLYATYVLFFDDLMSSLGNLSQVLALSVCQVLQDVQIKWPNDLILKGKKLGGILCETVWHEDKCVFLAGLGVNINMDGQMLEKIDRPAISLQKAYGKAFDRQDVSEKIHSRFCFNLELFLKEGFGPLAGVFKEKIIHEKGDKLTFFAFQKQVEGVFQRIEADGSLFLILQDGVECRFTSGELL